METRPETPPPAPPLQPGAIHVWRVQSCLSTEVLQKLEALLSPEELAKAARFRYEFDRVRYLTAHAGLRTILAGYLACHPTDVNIQPGALGKPLLSGPGRSGSLGFNLSHSGELSLVAVGYAEYIGVDIEQPRPLADLMEVASNVLSGAEMNVLQDREYQDRTRCFLEMWTRKEAAVKAAGLGIGAALDAIEVDPPDPATSQQFQIVAGLEDTPSLFGRRFTPTQDYYAAVVCEGSTPQIRLLDLRMD